MIEFFVNLKRFDVPVGLGGICSTEDSVEWAESIVDKSIELGLGERDELHITYLFPESIISSAWQRLAEHVPEQRRRLSIGSQSVFREDVDPDGNFGAFTTNLPAAAAKNLHCEWAMVGHSEERQDLTGVLEHYDPLVASDFVSLRRAEDAVARIMNRQIMAALGRGIKVLYCVGETEEARGPGPFERQKPRIAEALRRQISSELAHVGSHLREGDEFAIGYEPRWAIGPGKDTPDKTYIEYVAGIIQEEVRCVIGLDPSIVYGGGLKRENAEMIGSATNITGGLVALTKFTPPIGFDVTELSAIVDLFSRQNK
ncbi:MAG TPA: triose-phosphate isomerase [Spirochaetia bacterium]|nr:triose-phosphate isomerase [Spirochaetia bacterium]